MLPLYQQIIDLTNTHKKQVLLLAQAALPESQFKAFRQLFLNEFGKSGFEKGLAKVLAEKQHKER